MKAVVDHAVADARAYERGGADAVIVENFGDAPFTPKAVAPETVAAMAVAGQAVRDAVSLPLGFNVLRNDGHAALALCAAAGGSFLRVNVLSGAMVTDQGLIEGCAYELLRLRRTLAPHVKIFADVHVKHASPLAPMPIEIAAVDAWERGGADALVLSGTGTGAATDLGEVERVRAACPDAKLAIGSGIHAGTVKQYLRFVDTVIVGSSLKRGGKLHAPVDPKRVATLAKLIASSR
jgi:membrane complex biogenesis BtpA family protein